jgi:hypothetical protein
VEVLGEVEGTGARVVVVAFAPVTSLSAYQHRFGLGDVLLLSDEARASYAAFGFGRGSFARVWLDPRVWRRYGALVARGRRPAPAHEDTLQLGGDVLADASGIVRWVYRSRGPEDRPGAGAVRGELARLGA